MEVIKVDIEIVVFLRVVVELEENDEDKFE